jgi:hypothetical protein
MTQLHAESADTLADIPKTKYVTFERVLNTPGWRTGGKIHIAADNGYRVYVGGTQVGSGQVTAAFPPTLSDPAVNTTGWQTPGHFDVPGEGGDVKMTVIAAHEKAWVANYSEPPNVRLRVRAPRAGGGGDDDDAVQTRKYTQPRRFVGHCPAVPSSSVLARHCNTSPPGRRR